MKGQADCLYQRITESTDYREILNIIGEYVNFTDADQLQRTEADTAQFAWDFELPIITKILIT